MKKQILVYLESENGRLAKASLEALHAAELLRDQTGYQVSAVITDDAAAETAGAYGADGVIAVSPAEYQPERCARTLAALFEKYGAVTLVLGATRDGKELAARTAAQLHIGCISDAIDLTDEGWQRAVYGGALRETVSYEDRYVVSVRAGTFGRPAMRPDPSAVPVTAEQVSDTPLRVVIREAVREMTEEVNLEDAEIIVAGGRGMGNAENFKLVEELAQALDGVVGASRPAIEEGWASRNRQVGQSGKMVAPKLYIACGISGAMQHVSGMAGSGCIVAINKDEDAPIFDIADVGIVGNVTEVLPLLIEEVRARKS